jgi:polysaccharide biosynthesis transport protein
LDAAKTPPGLEDGDPVLNLDLSRYLAAVRRYAWAILAIVAVSVTGTVIYTNRLPRIYQASASVQIEPRVADLIGQGQELLAGMGGGFEYYKQQQQVLSSYSLVKATVTQNELYLRLLGESERQGRPLDDQIEMATARMQRALAVRYPDQNRTMYVVTWNGDPDLAKDLANFHVATYVSYSKGLLSTRTSRASNAFEAEFLSAEGKLRQAEAKLYEFQKDKDPTAVSLEDRRTLVSANITSFTHRLNEARARRIELATKLERMKVLANQEVLASPLLLLGDSASFEALRAQYYTERNKFLELERVLGHKHLDYQTQKAKVDDLYANLQAEAKRLVAAVEEQYQTSLAAERVFETEVRRYRDEALALGPLIVETNRLERERKAAEDNYNLLRTRLSTSEMTSRVNERVDAINVRPLDPARRPSAPVYPRMRRNVMMAAAGSLLLGVMMAFLLVFLDRSVKSTEDAQHATGASVLGVIPILSEGEFKDNKERDRYVFEHPTSHVAECCRSLRTNIMFSAAERQLKTIVVSSAHQGEGKTTTVIYLGTTMAQSGQRVLLVDTDMRRPRLHESMGVSRTKGLSNLILGDQDYDDVIKTTEVPNLYLLPCGPTPPNPAELLMGRRFEAILGELSQRFDRVILDSPPLQVVTDAVVLSKQTDGLILVARAGKTLRDQLKRAANQVRDVGATISGVIVNEFDARSGGYGYYYGGYYGGYAADPDPAESRAS